MCMMKNDLFPICLLNTICLAIAVIIIIIIVPFPIHYRYLLNNEYRPSSFLCSNYWMESLIINPQRISH